MVQAWMFVNDGTDQFSPHRGADVPLEHVAQLGVLHWTVDPTGALEV
jgi:hypothetical protein